MKTLKYTLFQLFILGTLLIVQGCKDQCEDIICENGGACQDGICECPEGFSGPNCEIEDLCITQMVICENGGTCIEGVCDCPPGYLGFTCATPTDEQIQLLLDQGATPLELYMDNVPQTRLYGKMYKGGLIFYLNIDDGTGLVAASNDQTDGIVWGPTSLDVIELNNETKCADDCIVPEPEEINEGARIGDGATNTDKIIASHPIGYISAASFCRDLGPDWFLPSRGELYLMFINLRRKEHGGFSDDIYWSSTEINSSNAWNQSFRSNGGLQLGTLKYAHRHVRAAKAF